jgi:hypothetical protein
MKIKVAAQPRNSSRRVGLFEPVKSPLGQNNVAEYGSCAYVATSVQNPGFSKPGEFKSILREDIRVISEKTRLVSQDFLV